MRTVVRRWIFRSMTLLVMMMMTKMIMTRPIRKRKPVRGLTVAAGPEIVIMEDGIDVLLAHGLTLQDQPEAVQGLVLLKEVGRGAPLAREADPGVAQGHQDGREDPEDLTQEVGPSLVPVLETVTETKDGGGDQGVGHVIAGARDPGQGHMTEGGATVLVLVREIVTGEILTEMLCV